MSSHNFILSKKKIKLLFDTENVVRFFEMNSTRSGIFFSSYNILKELSKNEALDITLYCKYCDLFLLKKFLKYHPEINAKIAGNINIWNMFLSCLSYYKYVFRKAGGG